MLPISKIFDKINRQGEESELYLVLSIGGGKVKSGIWTFEQGEGKVLSFGSSEQWGGDSPEELVVASDTSIASAVANLSTISNRQPNKVILGLPESWVEGNGVKTAQTKILQTICHKLLLKPQGFVVTPEAISHYFKNKEGDLVSVILVSLEETQISVSLVIQGKFKGNQIVGRSNNLALDLEEGLLRFNYQDTLPPRIVIIDGEGQQEAKQTLVAYPWINPEKQKRISFLQLPKVDFAPENLEIEAVVLAGSQEIVFGKSKTETLVEEKINFSLPEEDFDFIKGRDIVAEAGPAILPSEEPEITPVWEIPPPLSLSKKPLNVKKRLLPFLGFFKKITGLLKLVKFRFGFPKKGFVFFGLGLGFVLLLSLFSYLKLVRAQVNLLVQPVVIEKEIEFTVSDKISEPDIGKKILPALEVTTEISGNKSDSVKGRKTVGEKAKGEVNIYNGTDNKKTFPKGTAVNGPEGLRFIFDGVITVPARMTDINSSPPVDRWGEGKVMVVAREIGTQYNISANSNLTLESNTGTVSAVIVRNPSDFSGGSSREISAVSKEDRENLQKALLTELRTQAEQDLKIKVGDGIVLADSLILKNKTDRFDRETGDEADRLTLEEGAVFSVSYFKQEAMTDLIRQETASLVPEGYNHNPVKEDKKLITRDKTKNIYAVQLSQYYHPEISLTETASLLKGKLLSQAKKILGSVKYISGYDVQITPKIFSFFSIFPFNSKNIIITVKSI